MMAPHIQCYEDAPHTTLAPIGIGGLFGFSIGFPMSAVRARRRSQVLFK